MPLPHVDHPSHHVSPNDAARGTLVLMGGAVESTNEAFQTFVRLVGGREDGGRGGGGGGRIVGLTTASADPTESARLWRADFRRAGVTDVEFPIFERGDGGRDREIAEMIGTARGVFLGGGDQVKLVSCLEGSRTLSAIKALYAAGGVVAGSSAGAAALTELTMAGGEIDEEGNLVEQYIGPGFGLLGYGTIVDTHFSQRRRLQRLFVVVAQNTQLFGVGIDEDTALVVRDGVGEVVGAGGVTFVDGRDSVRFDNADDIERGRQLTLSHLRVGIVGTRYHLNLRERELDELVRGTESRHLRQPAEPRAGRGGRSPSARGGSADTD